MEASNRRPLQPYPTLFTTFAGAAFNGLLIYSMTWECRINGLALAALGSVSVNFSHTLMKDSSVPWRCNAIFTQKCRSTYCFSTSRSESSKDG